MPHQSLATVSSSERTTMPRPAAWASCMRRTSGANSSVGNTWFCVRSKEPWLIMLRLVGITPKKPGIEASISDPVKSSVYGSQLPVGWRGVPKSAKAKISSTPRCMNERMFRFARQPPSDHSMSSATGAARSGDHRVSCMPRSSEAGSGKSSTKAPMKKLEAPAVRPTERGTSGTGTSTRPSASPEARPLAGGVEPPAAKGSTKPPTCVVDAPALSLVYSTSLEAHMPTA
mmetsp:Transcript_14616/g.49506  ORF Transcript_14616/g.49506 Transcript_14616/m.49506 type:complete len:230 (-) Transcript_14616:820-1509(-)